MRTVVKVYRGIAAEYAEWRASLGIFGHLIERELHDELIRSEGRPSGSHRALHRPPGTFLWRYSGNATLEFTVTLQYAPKRPRPGGSVIGRAWRWLKWRVNRERVRAITVTAIGNELEP